MYIYHVFFIFSSVVWHLGCFCVFTIINSTATNIGVHVSFQAMFSLDICLGVGLQGHMVALFLVFEGTSILFSIVAV